ncbi:MAG TPA: hypothetical protein VIM01_17830 [Dermatophilaceae bacterium]|jgi:hypothetical protein
MTTKRRVGEQRSTTDGVDELAGTHKRTRQTQTKARRDAMADAAVDEGLADDVAVTPDPADLDRRERRQSSQRKASGPTKAPTEAAKPTAPPPGAPPPSDPQ